MDLLRWFGIEVHVYRWYQARSPFLRATPATETAREARRDFRLHVIQIGLGLRARGRWRITFRLTHWSPLLA